MVDMDIYIVINKDTHAHVTIKTEKHDEVRVTGS